MTLSCEHAPRLTGTEVRSILAAMDHTEIYTAALLDLSGTIATPILPPDDYPWLALPRIADFLAALLAEPPAGYRLAAPGVLVGEGCSLSAHAELRGPAIIGPGTEMRTGAYVRENVIVGARCVIGNSTELKNCILFDEVQVPHFNYVGDSILGRRAHLGAGAILSNVKSDGSEVAVRFADGAAVRTGLAKFGAILGDGVEIGCNAVCNPGSVVGRLARVHPLASLRGFLPSATIFKAGGERVAREDVAGGNRS